VAVRIIETSDPAETESLGAELAVGLTGGDVVLVRGEIFTEFTEPPFDREALIAATEGMGAS